VNRQTIKRIILNYLLPPAIGGSAQRMMLPRTQKFWRGEPLDASPMESRWFKSRGLIAKTITRNDDSRVAARVNGTVNFPIDIQENTFAIQLAISAVREWGDGASVDIAIGDRKIKHTGLIRDGWMDVRISVAGIEESIAIKTTSPIYISFPRAVRHHKKTTKNGAQHILVLVMDGLSPRLLKRKDEENKSYLSVGPRTDAWFSNGYSAFNGWSSGEWTMPTTASFFTGRYTSGHAIFHPTRKTMMPSHGLLLAEYLQNAGYHTLGLSTANRLTPAYGCNRGFDRFIYHWPEKGHTAAHYEPSRWISEIIGHLDTHSDDRTFTYAHFPDTHPAWNVSPLNRSFNLQRYGDSVGLKLDKLRDSGNAMEQGNQLNDIRLLEHDRLLGWLYGYLEERFGDDVLVVMTADHGSPWEHIRPRRNVDEPTLVSDRITTFMKMRGPGVSKNNYEGLINTTLDLMPTILARAGIAMAGNIDGRDLLASGYNRNNIISESIYSNMYEIHVTDGERSRIERYPINEDDMRLTGDAVYVGSFKADTRDYRESLNIDTSDLSGLAKAHMQTMGLTA